MSALQSLLDKLSDHEDQNKRTTPSPSQRNSSPNAFTKTEIEMAKTLCTLPSNGHEERMEDGGTNGTEEQIVKEEVIKGEAIGEDKFGDGAGGYTICRPIDRPLSTLSGEKIFLNANFESFAEFDCAFEEWKSLYKHPFRVASSEKHHDPKFKYRYVVYHCSRYGEPRKRGQGRRPHQNYLPCGCLAKLRLNFHPQPGDGCLCVTTLHTEHNHEPMSECHSAWLKRRKSSPEEDATAGSAERSAEGGRDFESSTVSGEHSPNSTASSSTAMFSPLSLHAAQPLQLLHNSPSSSGGQSSSESAGSSSSVGGETAAMAALLMRTMPPPSPLSEAIGGGKPLRQTTTGRPPSAMFIDSGELGTQQPSFSVPCKHSMVASASHSVHGSPAQQSQHSLLLSTLKAALMANANKDERTPQTDTGIGSACKRLAGELIRQQQRTTAADKRRMDQQQMQQQQQWHTLPIIQELLRLEQQQNLLINGTSSNGINQSQSVNPTHQTLSALICQSLQRDQSAPSTAANSNISNTSTASAFPPPASPLGTSASVLLSALRSINGPSASSTLPVSSSVGFFPSNQSSSSSLPLSPSSLLHASTVSPLIGLLQQAHLISTIGHPYGVNGASQRLSPPLQTQQQNGNGTAAYLAQQMQMRAEKQQRREQQQMEGNNNALSMSRAEIIKEADFLLQTLVNQMIHSKDLVSYLARLRQFLSGSTP